MSVLISTELAGGIEVLHARPADAGDSRLPGVLLLHSFTQSKELVSFQAYMLAETGLRVIVPDAPGHGVRFDGDGAKRLRNFWQICELYSSELTSIRQAFDPLLHPTRIGVAGISMGACAALAATVKHGWIAATAALMGSAYFTELSRTVHPPLGRYDAAVADEHDRTIEAMGLTDPSKLIERLSDRPLFLWHGHKDDVIPHANTLKLFSELRSINGHGFSRVVLDPTGSHRVTDLAAREVVDFFKKTLVGS